MKATLLWGDRKKKRGLHKKWARYYQLCWFHRLVSFRRIFISFWIKSIKESDTEPQNTTHTKTTHETSRLFDRFMNHFVCAFWSSRRYSVEKFLVRWILWVCFSQRTGKVFTWQNVNKQHLHKIKLFSVYARIRCWRVAAKQNHHLISWND